MTLRRPGRDIDAAGVGGLLVMTLVAWLAVVAPMLRARQERADLRAAIEAEERLATRHDADAEALREAIERGRRRLRDATLRLAPRDQLNARLAEIIMLASEAGIEILQTHTGVVESTENYERVPLRISGTGAYADCARFLRSLHASLPDTGVVGFELSGNPAKEAGTATFQFDLVWYAATTWTAGAAE